MEKKASVIVRHLNAPYQEESRTHFKPLGEEMVREIKAAVTEIFDKSGGESLLKESREVFIKPNGIDGQPYCYTRPELVEAVIEYWKAHGAKKIWLFENSTQSNATRLVFAVIGYDKICKRTGAVPVYLDEDKTVSYEFKGKRSVEDDPDGYFVTTFDMPQFVVRHLIEDRDKNLYISLPKLKTHSMAGVTLGVKNQWAFPAQPSRGFDHNYNLHHKLADVLSYVRPDFTLLEGVEGTIYGHYPVTALADKAVLPLKVLVAGKNVVATDMVGARIFGLTLDAPFSGYLSFELSREMKKPETVAAFARIVAAAVPGVCPSTDVPALTAAIVSAAYGMIPKTVLEYDGITVEVQGSSKSDTCVSLKLK